MTRLIDLCSLIRSKNAGPFWLTFDFVARDQKTYDVLRTCGVLHPQLFADLYGADPTTVLLVHHDRAQAVKVSLPRPVRQGDLQDPTATAASSTPRWSTWRSHLSRDLARARLRSRQCLQADAPRVERQPAPGKPQPASNEHACGI